MAARRNKNRAFHEFVQVGTADTAPRNINADSTRSYGGLWNVFDADVAFVIKNVLAFIVTLLFFSGGRLKKTVN